MRFATELLLDGIPVQHRVISVRSVYGQDSKERLWGKDCVARNKDRETFVLLHMLSVSQSEGCYLKQQGCAAVGWIPPLGPCTTATGRFPGKGFLIENAESPVSFGS